MRLAIRRLATRADNDESDSVHDRCWQVRDRGVSESGNEHSFEGRCHCGAIAFSFRTAQTPDRWTLRACQCRFCRSHGACTTSDPQGSVVFHIANPAKLHRYRFASRTADFVVCRSCGTYVAAVVTSPRGQFATLNVNAIAGIDALPEANPVSYEGESAEQKRERRERRWTPVHCSI